MARSELDLLLFATARLSAGALSFLLLIGIVLLQLGFCRAKNVISILLAQVANLALASLSYALLGFGFMFGTSRGWIGTDSFLAQLPEGRGGWCFLLCQTLLCAAAGAIAQGGLVERAKLGAHVALTLFSSLLIYPLFGSWVWGSQLHGGGWLEAGPNGLLATIGLPPFIDVGGASALHGVGAWVALAASSCIGPRAGKFAAAGREVPLLGHSMVLVAQGGLCFWLGSFGLQLGAALDGSALDGSAQAPTQLALPLLNTQLAAAAGAAAAMLTSWRLNGKPDIGISISGGLAGLVAISAGASLVTVRGAIALGFVAGVLVVAAILWAERRGIDDPVGASSVHGVAGAWGCLALALFHREGPSLQQLAAQAIGVLACFAWSFGSAFALFRAAMAWGWLRVPEQAELAGLDLWEHDAEAYPPDLQTAGVDER